MANHNTKKQNILFYLSSLGLFICVYILNILVYYWSDPDREPLGGIIFVLILIIASYFMSNFHSLIAPKIKGYIISFYVGFALGLLICIIYVLQYTKVVTTIYTYFGTTLSFEVHEYIVMSLAFLVGLSIHIVFGHGQRGKFD